jgi:HPt (histidine-containing phosphotransfer) domain-containing protein
MEENDAIDKAVFNNLLEAVGGDGEFLTELLETYFTDTPQQFNTMQVALSKGNAEDFRRAAHTLKSNSASFGAKTLSQKAKDLEEIGKAGNLDLAGEPLIEAEAEYSKVKSALEAIQKNG